MVTVECREEEKEVDGEHESRKGSKKEARENYKK